MFVTISPEPMEDGEDRIRGSIYMVLTVIIIQQFYYQQFTITIRLVVFPFPLLQYSQE